MTKAREGVDQADWDRAALDASLGVGHIWTNVHCPAYRTMRSADCDCQVKA